MDGFFTEIWIEIVFFIMIIASVMILKVWVGVVIFILWSIVRVYLKTNCKLEGYEKNL